ncbi:UPF0058 family protein [Halomarina salina]|uniref:UPF0058 family protein n=1 Tax=Halomarina salina TaxID=1872699 RepID=A0ABD5RH54_9EURY|nr:UPF0058 family protein [Halomarina salina]
MRKRELVHVHALLARIRWYADDRGDLPADALDEYDALGVAPTAVYRSKQAHEEAVITLTESLASAVEDTEPTDERSPSHDDQAASAQGD